MPATPVTVEQQPDQAQVFGGEQTVTLPPVVGGAEELDNVSESEDSVRVQGVPHPASVPERAEGTSSSPSWCWRSCWWQESAASCCGRAASPENTMMPWQPARGIRTVWQGEEGAECGIEERRKRPVDHHASQVTDATTIEQLKQQVNNAGHYGEAQSCAASRSLTELKNGTETMETQTADMNRSARGDRRRFPQ